MRSSKHEKQLRMQIAQEAARIIISEGLNDYLRAKTKAADKFGVAKKALLPSNSEVESAVIEYQTLFNRDNHQASLKFLRKTALQAMRHLIKFQPRLTGSVLSGSAQLKSEIVLHLFEDTPELVALFLGECKIPYVECERHITDSANNCHYYPSYKFLADDVEIVLIVLPLIQLKINPIDPVSGKSMRRAKISEVETLTE